MTSRESYIGFLKGKIPQAEVAGFGPPSAPHESLFPHQRDICEWAIRGGRRAVFANFGLGKTRMHLQLATWVCEETAGKFLIICPLGVRQEFTQSDGPAMGLELHFCRTTAEALASDCGIIVTNYESVRDGKMDPNIFAGVGMDEADVLRSFGSKTYQTFLPLFKSVRYRFVFTATPSPNRYKELIHYGGFLGVMDTGEALTRFFQRDSSQAGNLTLFPHMEKQFWHWLASWAAFIQRPSDLGYSDEGYDLPAIHVHWHRLECDHTKAWETADSWGQHQLFQDQAVGLKESAETKRGSIAMRVEKAESIMCSEWLDRCNPELSPYDENQAKPAHWIVWHDLEDERRAIEKAMPEAKTVYGSQDLEIREELIMGFSRGEYSILATKPIIAGSGCNFQRHCHNAVFLGVGYKFKDFIQAIHRIHRFQQGREVNIHIVHLDSEDAIVEDLKTKWRLHDALQARMTGIMRKYKLSTTTDMELIRTMIADGERAEVKGELFRAIRNDCILELMPVDSGHNLGHNISHDGSAKEVARSPQGRQADLRCGIPGEERGKEESSGTRMVSEEPGKVHCEGHALEQGECRGEASSEREIYGKQPRKDSGKDQSLVSKKQGACAEKGAGGWLEKEIRDHSSGVHETDGRPGLPVQDLPERVRPQASSGGSLSHDGQGEGDSLLPVQHGAGAIHGQSDISSERDQVSGGEPWPDNCVDMILTSIPFGNQYEYSPSYNDLGHNSDNDAFFDQMAFLCPNLLRVLRPGRIAAIHVKDRIRFGNVTGDGFPTVDPFSDMTVAAFRKAGFRLMARITVDTDVVRENNQTYRLAHKEVVKDGTKMGAGMPEYVLIFRKLPSDTSNGYADVPVAKNKADYSVADWQVHAAGIYKSDGDRLPDPELLKHMPLGDLKRFWEAHCLKNGYNLEEHIALAQSIKDMGRLPGTFMLFPAISKHPDIWTDIQRINTLNSAQSQHQKEKHVCPLQLDIIKRLITRYTNPGEIVYDPFGGIGSVPYQAIRMGRHGWMTELNEDYWKCAVGYCEAAENEVNVPTLFDMSAGILAGKGDAA